MTNYVNPLSQRPTRNWTMIILSLTIKLFYKPHLGDATSINIHLTLAFLFLVLYTPNGQTKPQKTSQNKNFHINLNVLYSSYFIIKFSNEENWKISFPTTRTYFIYLIIFKMGVSKNRGTPWYPQIIHFNKVFHYKSSILGYHYF